MLAAALALLPLSTPSAWAILPANGPDKPKRLSAEAAHLEAKREACNGGVDGFDFSDPGHPAGVAFWDETYDNWSAYWHERPGLGGGQFPVYGTDGVEDPFTGEVFHVFSVLSDLATPALPYLNPQTQEKVLGEGPGMPKGKKPQRLRSAVADKGKGKARASRAAGRSARHLAP